MDSAVAPVPSGSLRRNVDHPLEPTKDPRWYVVRNMRRAVIEARALSAGTHLHRALLAAMPADPFPLPADPPHARLTERTLGQRQKATILHRGLRMLSLARSDLTVVGIAASGSGH